MMLARMLPRAKFSPASHRVDDDHPGSEENGDAGRDEGEEEKYWADGPEVGREYGDKARDGDNRRQEKQLDESEAPWADFLSVQRHQVAWGGC